MPRGRPRGRGRGGRASSGRISTPVVNVSDEEMQDVDASRTASPQHTEDAPEDVGDDSDDAEQNIPSEHSSPPVIPIPRKRRLGRPPKNRPPDWDSPRPDNEQSEGGTPVKRRRGRPAGSGFRGRPRGSYTPSTRVKVDKDGTMMEVVNDEVALPDDPEGEEKVDKLGNLKGGREYRVRVFTVKNRGKRLYMLSTEPARCCGFRDSYLFFTKHMYLHKVIIEDEEKRDLIEREIIPHSYKGRSIGIVTARSVFREFGSRIVVGGKKIIDDYNVAAARERGDVEGELADPNDELPAEGEPYNKNRYVAWHGASAVYHTGTPAVPLTTGKVVLGKRKVAITSANWQIEHARAASHFNAVLAANRRANLNGVYDPHTNTMHYPKIMQPTHAKWEPVIHEREAGDAKSHLTNGITHLTNGVGHVSLNDSTPKARPANTVFSAVSDVVKRNYLIVDTKFRSPSGIGFGIPGPDGDLLALGHNGLPHVDDEILAELPSSCRQALEVTHRKEMEWKQTWKTEAEDGNRPELKIGFLGFPV
ncbi:hypothetical protein EJ06DRAFT_532246 [Trichodelitschia bisporula]|uniref:Nuclear localization protein n=1 Tax=Trichodelitschia bisporula TaxID=703511 RepID=A0A6G1HRP2_9PEZI|nr:hypothetical protein EJ06DRAFT_532246 [Trichodelitschia bisporula]